MGKKYTTTYIFVCKSLCNVKVMRSFDVTTMSFLFFDEKQPPPPNIDAIQLPGLLFLDALHSNHILHFARQKCICSVLHGILQQRSVYLWFLRFYFSIRMQMGWGTHSRGRWWYDGKSARMPQQHFIYQN